MADFAFRQIRNLPCPVNCNDGAVSLFSPYLRIILFGGERQEFSVLQNLAVLCHKAEIKLQHFAMLRREVFEPYRNLRNGEQGRQQLARCVFRRRIRAPCQHVGMHGGGSACKAQVRRTEAVGKRVPRAVRNAEHIAVIAD